MTAPVDHPSALGLKEAFPDALQEVRVTGAGQTVVRVDGSQLLDIMRWLRDTPQERYDLLVDVTAVDYGGGRPLEAVYQLWSVPHRRQLRVKVELPLDRLEVDSVVPLWAAANWLEREVYDMFGITFHGHPDLRRILMPHDYLEGHPLRKDFPLRGRFTRAEQTRRALDKEVEDYYLPGEIRPGRDPQTLPPHSQGGAGRNPAGSDGGGE